jgi:hypothetical protein
LKSVSGRNRRGGMLHGRLLRVEIGAGHTERGRRPPSSCGPRWCVIAGVEGGEGLFRGGRKEVPLPRQRGGV